jgi:beta-galactosidase GanA
VQRVARLVAGQAWFVAWFADNELGMDDLHRHVYSAHCAQAFQTFLRHRYATIETLNAAWHTRFASFAELLRRRPDPEIHSGPMFQDFKTFARDIIRQYVRVTESILRAADPDHLLFSPRFSRDAVDVWLDYLPEFARFDAMALNFYSGNYTWDPGLERAGRQLLHEIYARTGKPLLISEWSVPALDSGLYNHERRLDHSWPQAVLTQEHRALQAARLAIDFANIPYVIGSHWFIWSDIDRADRQANRGLYRTTGAPWAELLTHLGAAQQRIGRRFAPPGDRAAPGNGPRR